MLKVGFRDCNSKSNTGLFGAQIDGTSCAPRGSHCESVCPLQGSKTPKSGKEGFGVKKPPFPPTPEKGVSSRKIPISLQGTTGKMGIFRLKTPFSGVGGNGGFLTPKPSFPDLGFLTPVRGKRIRKARTSVPKKNRSKCSNAFGVLKIQSAPKERRRRRAEKRLSKRVFWRVRFFFSAPLRFALEVLKKRTLQKHPFGQPFLRTTPSPLLWRAPKMLNILEMTPNSRTGKTPKENLHKEFRRDPGRGVKEGA